MRSDRSLAVGFRVSQALILGVPSICLVLVTETRTSGTHRQLKIVPKAFLQDCKWRPEIILNLTASTGFGGTRGVYIV